MHVQADITYYHSGIEWGAQYIILFYHCFSFHWRDSCPVIMRLPDPFNGLTSLQHWQYPANPSTLGYHIIFAVQTMYQPP